MMLLLLYPPLLIYDFMLYHFCLCELQTVFVCENWNKVFKVVYQVSP